MRPGRTRRPVSALAAALVLVFAPAGRGDEPGRLGRLFRFGGSKPATAPAPEDDVPAVPEARAASPRGGPPTSVPSPAPGEPAHPRLLPQPRVSRAATDADPVVTRVTLGRSDDGTQFGMFLQVYADGTVIDSEGVHHVGREAIRDVLGAVERGDLGRIKGHCGGPSTDFVETVQVVVYERSMGRLRANAFSFSGNPQGCDHAVRHLQATLDALQARTSRAAAPTTVSPGSPTEPRPAHVSPAPIPLNDRSLPTGH